MSDGNSSAIVLDDRSFVTEKRAKKMLWLRVRGAGLKYSLLDWFAGERQGSRLTAAIFLTLATVEVFVAGANVAVVFPLLLISLGAFGKSPVTVWRYVLLLVLATFGLYAIKYQLVLAERHELFFSYRFFNRALAAATLLLLGAAIEAWKQWQFNRVFLDNHDRAVTDPVVQLKALTGGAILALFIAAVDFFSPANINWAPFYAIALFLVSWTRVQPLIMLSAAFFVILTGVGCLLGPLDFPLDAVSSVFLNRSAVLVTLLITATLLHSRAACPTKF